MRPRLASSTFLKSTPTWRFQDIHNLIRNKTIIQKHKHPSPSCDIKAPTMQTRPLEFTTTSPLSIFTL
jgi:hypothetical protein